MTATSRRRASQQRAAWYDRVLSWSEQVEASEPFARIRDTIFELGLGYWGEPPGYPGLVGLGPDACRLRAGALPRRRRRPQAQS